MQSDPVHKSLLCCPTVIQNQTIKLKACSNRKNLKTTIKNVIPMANVVFKRVEKKKMLDTSICLLFPQCLQKPCSVGLLKLVICLVKGYYQVLNPFPNDKF